MSWQFLMAAALLGPASAAGAEQWQVAGTALENRVVVLVDIATIQAEPGELPSAHLLTVFREDVKQGEMPVAALRTRVEFDCAGHRLHAHGEALLDAKGTVLSARDDAGAWMPIDQRLSGAEAVVCGSGGPADAPRFVSALPIGEARDYLRALPSAEGKAP